VFYPVFDVTLHLIIPR